MLGSLFGYVKQQIQLNAVIDDFSDLTQSHSALVFFGEFWGREGWQMHVAEKETRGANGKKKGVVTERN